MFDHVTIRSADLTASERFYRTVLTSVSAQPTTTGQDLIEWEDFVLLAAGVEQSSTRHLHVAFGAPSREHVDAFWQSGVDAGYDDAGSPGERPQYKPGYYGTFLLDPDGNSVEAVHHDDVRRGGHIDHLWIGVRDVMASEAFYAAIARHTGLRRGRRWEGGVQFRGAWATFSLVQDGRPPTEGLHLALPARDRATVEDFHRAAVAAGHPSNGEPGERPKHHPGYYSACALDPDGTNVESVWHGQNF